MKAVFVLCLVACVVLAVTAQHNCDNDNTCHHHHCHHGGSATCTPDGCSCDRSVEVRQAQHNPDEHHHHCVVNGCHVLCPNGVTQHCDHVHGCTCNN